MNCKIGEVSYFSCPVRLSSIIGRPATVPSRPASAACFSYWSIQAMPSVSSRSRARVTAT
ncbi:hypothetical protein [Wenjunlia tyrosinilytica]|uniref:hypothetical protein n=1 Tax=Wenjunlia tyrosinilytica TaxID=1544741 RepID=UPI001664439E|nr:hypothetical protein [Wenjunlia tyrosinilytica]